MAISVINVCINLKAKLISKDLSVIEKKKICRYWPIIYVFLDFKAVTYDEPPKMKSLKAVFFYFVICFGSREKAPSGTIRHHQAPSAQILAPSAGCRFLMRFPSCTQTLGALRGCLRPGEVKTTINE